MDSLAEPLYVVNSHYSLRNLLQQRIRGTRCPLHFFCNKRDPAKQWKMHGRPSLKQIFHSLLSETMAKRVIHDRQVAIPGSDVGIFIEGLPKARMDVEVEVSICSRITCVVTACQALTGR